MAKVDKKRYGANEYLYARPIAAALVEDSTFRGWFLDRIAVPINARLLHQEQFERRSKGAENWCRSYWAGSQYPFKDEFGERETDLLAVFEHSGCRVAVHVEVKAPATNLASNRFSITHVGPPAGRVQGEHPERF